MASGMKDVNNMSDVRGTYRPYNEPEFRNMRPYLEPNFPNDYPYSQYINHEGELVYRPWRDSEDTRGYCRSQYADEEQVVDTKKCDLKNIEPLYLPTQYSSEESSVDSDECGENTMRKEPPEMLMPVLKLRNFDEDSDDEDDIFTVKDCDTNKTVEVNGVLKMCENVRQMQRNLMKDKDTDKKSNCDAGSKKGEAVREDVKDKIDKMKSKKSDVKMGVAQPEEVCQIIDTEEEWIKTRWPYRVWYGKEGKLRHPYSRMEKPNLKSMSCRYRCKSYRTFKCSARLDIFEDPENPGDDIKSGWGDHSERCQKKNGIAPKDFVDESDLVGSKLKDRTEEFKSRLGELAADKIWLPPMKIWSMVRDEFVASDENALVTVPSSDVVSTFIWSYTVFFQCFFYIGVFVFHRDVI